MTGAEETNPRPDEFMYEDRIGKRRNDWIAQAGEAIEALKGTSRLAHTFDLSTDVAPNHPTPFRIESTVINDDQKQSLLSDTIEPLETVLKALPIPHMEKTFPSKKKLKGIRYPPCEVITVDSTQAVGAPEGVRLRATADRDIDFIVFLLYEDDTFELAIRDKESADGEELAYGSGKKILDEMSVYEWDVANAILNQVWFDMHVANTRRMIEKQEEKASRPYRKSTTEARRGDPAIDRSGKKKKLNKKFLKA